MTEIDVPDWVAADVLSRYSALRIERGDNEPFPPELARQQRQDDMRAALTAALEAEVAFYRESFDACRAKLDLIGKEIFDTENLGGQSVSTDRIAELLIGATP